MIIISNCVAEATLFLPFDKVTANLIRISNLFLLAVLNFYKLDKYAGENWTKKNISYLIQLLCFLLYVYLKDDYYSDLCRVFYTCYSLLHIYLPCQLKPI